MYTYPSFSNLEYLSVYSLIMAILQLDYSLSW